jgi:hypothetical protein
MRLRSAFGLVVVLLVAGWGCAATPIRILFMHHSTGANLVRERDSRRASTPGYEFRIMATTRKDSTTRAASRPSQLCCAGRQHGSRRLPQSSQAVTEPPRTRFPMLEYDDSVQELRPDVEHYRRRDARELQGILLAHSRPSTYIPARCSSPSRCRRSCETALALTRSGVPRTWFPTSS